MEQSKQVMQDQRIASKAKVWRQRDLAAIGNKGDGRKQIAEWRARQQLRETIDCAGQP